MIAETETLEKGKEVEYMRQHSPEIWVKATVVRTFQFTDGGLHFAELLTDTGITKGAEAFVNMRFSE